MDKLIGVRGFLCEDDIGGTLVSLCEPRLRGLAWRFVAS